MSLSPTDFRRALRQQSTAAERALWSVLRNRRLGGVKFRRQHSIGPYVADFYCERARLVIELDGSVHDDPSRSAYDSRRQRAMLDVGIRTVRFSNREVLDQADVVAAAILAAASEGPSPCPSPQGEGSPRLAGRALEPARAIAVGNVDADFGPVARFGSVERVDVPALVDQ